MREILNRIKRGELQLYLSLVETYIKQVYFSAKEVHDEEEAIHIVHEIFSKLYDKVLGYLFIYDAEKFVQKNLEKISANHGVLLEDKYIDDPRDVPQIVLRKILISISAKSTSKKRRSILITAPIIAIIFITGITFVSKVSSSNDTHPKGTIYKIEDQVEKVYQKKFEVASGYRATPVEKITNIHHISNESVLVESLDNDSYKYQIYKGEKPLDKVFDSKKRMRFITGTDDGALIFINDNYLERYNNNFEFEERLEVLGVPKVFSKNKRFCVDYLNGKNSIIDLYSFNEEEFIGGKVAYVMNNGSIITEEKLRDLGYAEILDDGSIISAYENNQLISIDANGLVDVYEDGNKTLSFQLAYYKDLESIKTYDYIPHMRTNIYANDEQFIFATRSRSNGYFEVYDRETGESLVALADSLRSGDHIPRPILSSDGRALLLATQYKTRRQALRFNAVYDLSSTNPIKEYHLSGVGHIELMEISGADGMYFIYTLDDFGYFRIYKVDFVDK